MTASSTAAPQAIHLKDYAPAPFHIDGVELDFALEPEKTLVTARLAMRRRDGSCAPLILDGEDLKLVSVCIDGTPLEPSAYEASPDKLTIADVPDIFTLETVVEIAPAANTALEGLYMSGQMFCTQCEAEGFRRITYFYDRPDVMTTYKVRLEADKARFPILLSNGNLLESGTSEAGRHFALWHDPHPKPSYLFALVAGDLGMIQDEFVTRSGRTVDLRIYTEHGNEPYCSFAMDALKRSMTWDEERFGREYDLDIFMIVAVGDFNSGAMENKGLNIFNAALILASPETATDLDYERIERVVAHEYFHNWTGNRITCRDWFQLCLKEGLTVYRDQEFGADMREANVSRIDDVTRLRAIQFPEDAGGLAHPVRPETYIKIDNFYTPTVYEKGAELVRMIETFVGRETFRKGMDLYFDEHDNTAATVEDFVGSFEKASGKDLAPFMRWYRQSGTPHLRAKGNYDAAAKSYSLTVEQMTPPTPGQAGKQPVPIPIRMGLIGPGGEAMPVTPEGQNVPETQTSAVLELTQSKQTFTFRDVAQKPVPSLLRGFSAPVILTTDLSVEERIHLIAHDEDAFNRRETAHTLAIGEIAAHAKGTAPGATREALIEALGACLADDTLDPAFLARLLTPPREDDVAQVLDVVDPGAVYQSREAYRRAVGEALRVPLTARLDAIDRTAPFDPGAIQAGQRALANAALLLLAATGDETILTRAMDQARTATNMTDKLAALSIVADQEGAERDEILADFYRQWEGNALVIDKWFSIQAASHRPQTMDDIEALSTHTAFTLRNPNRVRSLVGVMAAANPSVFHAKDGRGYKFFADQVLAIDKLNPLFAARLFGVVKTWRKLEPTRRALIKENFERIATSKPISDNLYEVVSLTLAD